MTSLSQGWRRWLLRAMVMIGLLAALVTQSEAAGVRIPTPAEIIRFEPGTDRTLVDYDQLIRYYKILDAASERVILKPVGTSTEGRTLYLLFISSPQNLMRLDAIQAVQQRLGDPRTLPPDEARKLIKDQPAAVFINNAIPSTEIAAPHFALQLAYHLASSDDPETLRILADVVLLMNPVNNPDGHDLVVRWYRQTLGTPYEGTSPPELYQHYAGHDNNRDWFMFNLQETRVWGPIIFREWLPSIIWDVHQMGSGGARFFVPPFFDPPNPGSGSDPPQRRMAADDREPRLHCLCHLRPVYAGPAGAPGVLLQHHGQPSLAHLRGDLRTLPQDHDPVRHDLHGLRIPPSSGGGLRCAGAVLSGYRRSVHRRSREGGGHHKCLG